MFGMHVPLFIIIIIEESMYVGMMHSLIKFHTYEEDTIYILVELDEDKDEDTQWIFDDEI